MTTYRAIFESLGESADDRIEWVFKWLISQNTVRFKPNFSHLFWFSRSLWRQEIHSNKSKIPQIRKDAQKFTCAFPSRPAWPALSSAFLITITLVLIGMLFGLLVNSQRNSTSARSLILKPDRLADRIISPSVPYLNIGARSTIDVKGAASLSAELGSEAAPRTWFKKDWRSQKALNGILARGHRTGHRSAESSGTIPAHWSLIGD